MPDRRTKISWLDIAALIAIAACIGGVLGYVGSHLQAAW